MNDVFYRLDGVNFRDFGVYVSDSEGIVSRPKLKAPATFSWDGYHGESVDLQHKFYEPRQITLSCFLKASSKEEFIRRVVEFERLFDRPGTCRLMISTAASPLKPLIYEVYCKDEIAVSKKWKDRAMAGTFKLKLTEPEPVKRILWHAGTSTACTVTLTTQKLVNIYWGDGLADFDISGDDLTVLHDYGKAGDYFIVIAGCIDEITSFQTNATIVWNLI
jgi:hypothetical protein